MVICFFFMMCVVLFICSILSILYICSAGRHVGWPFSTSFLIWKKKTLAFVLCVSPRSSFLLDLIWNRPLLPIITYAARRWSSLNRQNLSTVVLVVLFSRTLFIRVFVKLVAVKYLGCLVDQQGPYSIQIARKVREREKWGGVIFDVLNVSFSCKRTNSIEKKNRNTRNQRKCKRLSLSVNHSKSGLATCVCIRSARIRIEIVNNEWVRNIWEEHGS